jgi:DNA-binding SARP family transcriptional activator/tetratricopeptide (TPR) repeat protein
MGREGVPNGVAFTLVGAFGVAVDGRALRPAQIGSRQARTLLKLLVVERGTVVPTDRIVDVLWGAQPPRRPVGGVATLVSRLRATLGSGIISGAGAGYRLGPAVERATDLDMAAGLVRESESRLAAAPALALAAAQRALGLLDGVVLEDDLYADWAAPARTQAGALVRRARHLAAEAALAVGDPATARDLAEDAIAADVLDEAACRMVMHAGRALGEPARALLAYERLREALADELGADPAPATRVLHRDILQDRPAAPVPPAHRRAVETADAGLAGRAREVGGLARRWTAAAGGAPGAVLIAGEAGIGKTRLATQVARLAESTGGVVLQARCYGGERSLLLQPLVDALRPHLAAIPPARLRELADGWAPTLAAFMPEFASQLQAAPVQPGTAAPERRRLFEAVSMLLRRVSQQAPVLLLLDDLHNAGLGTVEFLHYLARHLAGARLLCLATVRDDEGAALLEQLADVADRVELGPLPAGAVARLAADAGHPALADHIHRRTGGHPLFVVETLRGLSTGEPGVPGSLQAAILARVRYAGPDVADVLRAAAVFGPQFQPDALAAMLAIPAITAARRCERALQLHLVVVAGRAYEFANDVIREVLYATTPEPTRVQHHRAAIELLDRHEAVAEHAVAAGEWPRAAGAWLRAGEHAMGRFAASDATVLLTRAISAAERTGDVAARSRAHLQRGRAHEALAAHADAWADHQAAMGLARRAGHGRLEMLALRELGGDVPLALGHSAASCMMYLEAGERLAAALGDREQQAGLLARLAILATNRLRFDVAEDHARRAVAAARASRRDHALAGALDGLKTVYAYLGEIAALEPVLAELLPLLRRRGDLWRLQWALFESALPAVARAEWDAAVACIDEAMAVNREAGYGDYAAWFIAHRGWVERLRGCPDEAVRHGRAAVEIASRARHPWWLAAANALLATTLLETGAVGEAVVLLEAGLAEADRSGTEAYRLRCLGPLAEATGRLDVVTRASELLGRVAAPSGAAWLAGADAYLGVARAWLARGEPARALDAVGPLLRAAERNHWSVVIDAAGAVAERCARHDGDGCNGTATTAFRLAGASRHDLPAQEP